MRCAVYGCCANNKGKNSNKKISFHSFPKESILCKHWVFSCGRKDKFNVITARICCNHFQENDFVPPNPVFEQYGMTNESKRLKQNVVPSLLLPFKRKRARNIKPCRIVTQTHTECDPQTTDNGADSSGSASNNFETDPLAIDGDLEQPTYLNPEPPCACSADCSTQTESTSPSYSELQNEIVKLKQQCWKQRKVIDSVGHIITKRQLRKLECPKKRISWSSEDIANAIAIHAAGPRAYRLLLRKEYPLPAVISLKKE